MYRDRDIELKGKPPPGAGDLMRDLGLETVFAAMSGGDAYLQDVARVAVFAGLHDPEEIRYRQSVLADCIASPEVIRRMYAVAVSALDRERHVWGFTYRRPEGLVHRSADVLGLFRDHLRELRSVAEAHRAAFRSEGFSTLFSTLLTELDDAYLAAVAEHLERLRFRRGLLLSARLGRGNRAAHYQVRKRPLDSRGLLPKVEDWVRQLVSRQVSRYVYELADRDESGFQALQEIRDRGLASVATALVASTAHILNYFNMLRAELGFYIGCLNLRERLVAKGEPVCFPDPLPVGECLVHARGIYDVSLSLSMDGGIVGNDVPAGPKNLVVITGANRGGKTTFLRSVGLAQILMQCGAFVGGEEYRAGVSAGVFTHFKREEDAGMRSGKLDEELSRMSGIVDHLVPGSLVLLNESFASTNEREGSEIARQIVRALLEKNVKVIYVTHLFDLAESLYRKPPGPVLFLRAERLPDGRRPFKLVQGEPLATSFGADVYARVFGKSTPMNAAAEGG